MVPIHLLPLASSLTPTSQLLPDAFIVICDEFQFIDRTPPQGKSNNKIDAKAQFNKLFKKSI